MVVFGIGSLNHDLIIALMTKKGDLMTKRSDLMTKRRRPAVLLLAKVKLNSLHNLRKASLINSMNLPETNCAKITKSNLKMTKAFCHQEICEKLQREAH